MFSEWFQGKPSPYDRLFDLISSLVAPIGAWLVAGFQTLPAQLNAANVTLGNNFVDIGDPVTTRFYNGIAVYGQFVKGDATAAVEFRWLIQYDVGGTLTPVEPKYGVDQETRSARTHYEFLPTGGAATTKDFLVELELKNHVPYVQLQGRCLGATTCQVQADAQYVLGY